MTKYEKIVTIMTAIVILISLVGIGVVVLTHFERVDHLKQQQLQQIKDKCEELGGDIVIIHKKVGMRTHDFLFCDDPNTMRVM